MEKLRLKKGARKHLVKKLEQIANWGAGLFTLSGLHAGSGWVLVGTACWWVLFQLLAVQVLNLDE